MSFRECYPFTKRPDFTELNAWLNGTRSTCHYSDSDGRKVVLFLDIEDLSQAHNDHLFWIFASSGLRNLLLQRQKWNGHRSHRHQTDRSVRIGTETTARSGFWRNKSHRRWNWGSTWLLAVHRNESNFVKLKLKRWNWLSMCKDFDYEEWTSHVRRNDHHSVSHFDRCSLRCQVKV